MLSVILPTFNEKENIARIVEGIFRVAENNNLKANIIVVDDNSPDGTAAAVKKLESEYPNQITLISRSHKLGLGSAYIVGFKHAINMGAEYIFEMDADLSHNPSELPQFIEAAKDYDLIIGSRYIQDGKIMNWSRLRKLISLGGTIYAKTILNLPINDLTSGYKCFRSHLLKSMDLENISSDGYSFQIELTYKAYQKGYKVKEIPIVFKDRNQGESKFSKKIFWEAIWMVWKMRLKK